MPRTTIRLSDDLKARVATAAERAGTSTHRFILEAIVEKVEKVEQAERRSDFEETAECRYAQLVASGRSVPWSEMRRYLETRVAGGEVRRPAARKLAR